MKTRAKVLDHNNLVNAIAGITTYIHDEDQMNYVYIMQELIEQSTKFGFSFDMKDAEEIIHSRIKHGILTLISTVSC